MALPSAAIKIRSVRTLDLSGLRTLVCVAGGLLLDDR